MPLELCQTCKTMHYATDSCRTSELKPNQEWYNGFDALDGHEPPPRALRVFPDPAQAANQLERTTSKAAEPDDISKSPARSSTPKPNRNEYHRVNMRKWRASKKAALTSQGVNSDA